MTFFIFLVIDNFFRKFTPFIQNLLPFLCIFLSFCFVSAFFHVFLTKIQKIKILVWLLGGGQKRGFAPHLKYWGARARAAPSESTPMTALQVLSLPVPSSHWQCRVSALIMSELDIGRASGAELSIQISAMHDGVWTQNLSINIPSRYTH